MDGPTCAGSPPPSTTGEEGGCSLACAIRRAARAMPPCRHGCSLLGVEEFAALQEVSRYLASPDVPDGRCPYEPVADMGSIVRQLVRQHGGIQVDPWTLRRGDR